MIRVRLPENEQIVAAGVASWLSSHPEIGFVPELCDAAADVHVAVTGLADGPFLKQLGETARRAGAVVVLALDNVADELVAEAAEARVMRLLQRATMSREVLVAAVIAAAEEHARGVIADEDSLMMDLEELRSAVRRPRTVLNRRDIELLNLVACGWEIREIATKNSLSQRTVLSQIQQAVKRCGARNRCEAVASTVRTGLL
ncbi:LuxR C-terminal-related transcriptional regulator [Lentzea sp. NPDC034063]|uniref:helix-turn-helix transcriptional regulator n=1 Tax=unclassified Lentzea TaxID=2643253 RepID=UPI0033C1039C